MAAATAITPTAIAWNTAVAVTATAAVEVTNGALIDATGKDHKLLITLENVASGASKVATISAGTMVQGVAALAVTIPQASVMYIVLESGKYKNSAGKIEIKGADVNVQVAAHILP